MVVAVMALVRFNVNVRGNQMALVWPGSPSKGHQRLPLALNQLQNSRRPCSPC